MDLESALNICHTCLSSNRKLYPLKMFPSLIQLNFLLVNQTATVCWECKNTILKFCDFITKAVKAQTIMMDARHIGDIVCLSTLDISKQQPLFEFTHIDDPLSHETDETQCIKEEIFNTDEENNTYHEDSEEIVNTEGDVKDDDSESFFIGDENGEVNESEIKVDVKTENDKEGESVTRYEKCEASSAVTISFEAAHEPKKNLLKVNSDEEQRKDMKINTLSDIRNKLLFVPEDVMKKILIVELTDEEVEKEREQKRSHYNFKKLPYKCDYCIIGFKTEENFNEHKKKKHDHAEHNNSNLPGFDYNCKFCHLRFKSIMIAQKHRQRHYIHYKCRLCKYEAYYEWAIVAHCREKHDNETVGQIHCNLCSVISSTPDEHSEHLKTQHSRTCELCGYKLQGMTLRAHMRRVHKQTRGFVCDHCLKCFRCKSELETHMASHDANIAKNLSYCSICSMQFKNIKTYKNHLKYTANHAKERYQCSECKKDFVSKYFYRRHYKFYHLKKSEYKCVECNKLFISESRLKDHQLKHLGLNRPRNHGCNVCGKKFHCGSILKEHKLIHSEQRSFMCSECGDTFKQPAALLTHTKLVHRIAKKLYKKQKKK